MNAVEIEQVISALAEGPFNAEAFRYQFLESFGAKAATIKRLRSGNTNKSDVGGVLQTSNIHIKVCEPDAVTETLLALKESPSTTRAKAKFVLATDTDIFANKDLFAATVEQMSERGSSNTHEIIAYWNLSLLASRLHLTWIATVCGKLETDFRHSNTMGWHTFPVPDFTEKNKNDLTRCAEGILLAREAHFPATIADLYDRDAMPENLRAVDECNDEGWSGFISAGGSRMTPSGWKSCLSFIRR